MTCPLCDNVKTKYRKQSTDNEILLMHTQRELYHENSIREDFRKRLSALRNSGGGVLLVHVNGTKPWDRCLDYFDKIVGRIVTDLLEAGEVYANMYRRQWLNDILVDCEDSAYFIYIRIEAVTGVATVDFNTKLGKDYENVNPTTQQLLTVRSKLRTPFVPVLKGLPNDYQQLHENIHIQLKGFKHQDTDEIQQNANTFVKYLWNQLKLKENLTAMSKIPDGGSCYLGIGEKKSRKTDPYKTIIPDAHGFELIVDEEELEETLRAKLQDCVLLNRSENTFTAVPPDLIAIRFHNHQTERNKVVLEVAVKCVEGVVFCDSDGPRTYVMEKGQICRMDKNVWLQRLM